MMRISTILLLLALLSLPLCASAETRIFLNGVDITEVRGQTFEEVNIKIDASGDIHIDAPQYRVEVQDKEGNVKETAGGINHSYFLVTSNSSPGKLGVALEVYLNGKLYRTVKATEAQVVVEITDQLSPGTNTVTLRAVKQGEGGGELVVMIGRGSSSGAELTLSKRFVNHTIKGGSEDSTENFTFTAD